MPEQVIKQLKELQLVGLTKAATIVEGSAVAKCPVDEGRLRDSITKEINEDYAIVGTNVEYAPWIEYGTKKMSAQPFMRPAIDENKSKIKRMFKKEMRKIK